MVGQETQRAATEILNLSRFLAILALAPLVAAAPAQAAPTRPAATPPASPLARGKTARPDLRKCEKYGPVKADETERRTKPLVFPAQFSTYVATDRDHVAVSSFSGRTICIDARFLHSIDNVRQFGNGRFFGYGWYGYEVNGYQLVDRAGNGALLDTGAMPVFSPSGSRLGAVEWSEAGFGMLNAVLVADVLPGEVSEVARIEQLPQYFADWRFDRWQGEECFEISAMKYDDAWAQDGSFNANAPRQKYKVFRSVKGWRLSPAPKGCART